MTSLGPHAVFILAAYVFAIIVIGALILRIVIDTRTQTRKLEALEARGAGRRRQAAARQTAPQQG